MMKTLKCQVKLSEEVRNGWIEFLPILHDFYIYYIYIYIYREREISIYIYIYIHTYIHTYIYIYRYAYTYMSLDIGLARFAGLYLVCFAACSLAARAVHRDTHYTVSQSWYCALVHLHPLMRQRLLGPTGLHECYLTAHSNCRGAG